MKSFNFITYLPVRKHQMIYQWFFLSLFFLTISCAFMLYTQIKEMKLYLKTKQELSRLTELVEKKKKTYLNKELSARQQKALVDPLDFNQKYYCPIPTYMSLIANSIPHDLCLTFASYYATKNKIMLKGSAQSLQGLTQFVRKLSQQEGFDVIALLKTHKISQTEHLSYEIELTLAC